MITSSVVALAEAPDSSQLFIVGVCTHFGQNAPYPGADLALAEQAGIRSIRDEASWGAVERKQGQLVMPAAYDAYVDAAVAHGIEPLLILDYGNALYDHGDKPRSADAIAAFARYAAFVARHFKGKVHWYEVWNEWSNNLGNTTPGSTEDYARLLKAVYPALKRVDPNITVLADQVIAGRERDSDYQRMRELELPSFADGISIHPYQGTPEESATELRNFETGVRRANQGAAIPLYATEVGWPTYGKGVGLTREAAYASRFLILAHTMPFVRGVWWYNFVNDGQNPDESYPNYGLVWADLSPKPAFAAFGNTIAMLRYSTFIGRASTGSDTDWLLRFRTTNNREVWALWTTQAGALTRFGLTTRASAPADVRSQEAGHQSVQRQWTADPRVTGLWHLNVTTGETPVFISGDLMQVSLDHVEHLAFPDDRR